eukprot:gene7372-15059_t
MDTKGVDDQGRFYTSLEDLHRVQEENKEIWYNSNMQWWESGYGGTTDDEAMIGDSDGESDALIGLLFLDNVLRKRPALKIQSALDCGAGVGRISKYILLRRCTGNVTLVEANLHWSERSRAYLGRKRAANCRFINSRLEHLDAHIPSNSMDLIWYQWCLQYLTDKDVIKSLQAAANSLTLHGIIIIKENKPTATTTGSTRINRFQMDTPDGPEGRYDITRPNAHHLYLFQSAGLSVIHWEDGVETISVALEKNK